MEKLGANPNDHQRHRKADTQRATNRQRECRKQIVFGLNLTSGHATTPLSPQEPLIPNGITEAELFVRNYLPALAAKHPVLPALPRV
jgi:hypothetical protein